MQIIYRVVILKEAYIDISNIYLYIQFKLLNPIASQNFLYNIKSKINNLKIFPYIGKIYKNRKERFVIHKKFLIFYEIQEENKLVIIKSVIHKNINKDK